MVLPDVCDAVVPITSLLVTKHYSGDHIEKNEMGGAYGTCAGTGEVHIAFWVERPWRKKQL